MSDPYAEFLKALNGAMASSVLGCYLDTGRDDPQEGKVARSYRNPVPEHYPVSCEGYTQRARDVIESREEKTVKKEQETPVPEGFYKSPHKIPRCTNPGEAAQYPHLHAARSENCPVHLDRYYKSAWRDWYEARERYAQPDISDAARRYAMAEMLSCVTAANPPPAPVKRPVRRPVTVAERRRRAHVLMVIAWTFLLPGLILGLVGAYAEGAVLDMLSVVPNVWAVVLSARNIRELRK